MKMEIIRLLCALRLMYAHLAFDKHLQLFTVTSLISISPRVEAVASVAYPHSDLASAAAC